MHALNIICSADVTLDTIKELSAPEILFRDKDNISVCFGNENGNYLAVTDIDAEPTDHDDSEDDFNVIDMYQGEQRSLILKHFDPAKVFLIQYTRFDGLKEFIEKTASLNVFIDNDKGKLLTIYDLRSVRKEQDFV